MPRIKQFYFKSNRVGVNANERDLSIIERQIIDNQTRLELRKHTIG
jgi:hypothetical protein